jgi:hypothetical protein
MTYFDVKWADDLSRPKTRTLPGEIIGYRKNGAPIRLAAGGAAPNKAGASLGGYQTQGDVVQKLPDGTDLNDLWAEFQATLNVFNEHRQTLVDFLTFPVTNNVESVPQGTTVDFETASEFGIPKGVGTKINYFQMGYDFEWYDVATRYTWKFLLEADARQVEMIHQQILEGDNRNIFNKVMNALFRNTNRTASISGNNYNVYSLYNGSLAAAEVPPPYKSNTFDTTHNHYLTTNLAAPVEPSNQLHSNGVVDATKNGVEQMMDHLRHHGYGESEGATMIMLVNKQEADVIRLWRLGAAGNLYRAHYDFVPSNSAAPMILPNALLGAGLLGQQPPSSIGGLPVVGSYGPVLVVQEDYIPPGYILMFATGGTAGTPNPVGLREHANATARGLQLLPGNQSGYPLQDSYYRRGFGTGIRQRGAAVIMQVVTGTTYTIPTQYA